MSKEDAKIEFNGLLERYNNANTYFERVDITIQDKERALKTFKEILKGLNYYLGQIKEYTKYEVLGGFKVGE